MKIRISNGELHVYEDYLKNIKAHESNLNLELKRENSPTKKEQKEKNDLFNQMLDEEIEKLRKR